jgi:phosphomannomutase
MTACRRNLKCSFGLVLTLNVAEINIVFSFFFGVKTGEESEITLPKSNVLAYTLTNGNKVIVRPSGTEPKIKAYITAIGQSEENAKEIAQKLLDDANELMK